MISVIIMPACLPTLAFITISVPLYSLCIYGNFGHFFPKKNFCGILIASFFWGHQVAKFHPQKKESK